MSYTSCCNNSSDSDGGALRTLVFTAVSYDRNHDVVRVGVILEVSFCEKVSVILISGSADCGKTKVE